MGVINGQWSAPQYHEKYTKGVHPPTDQNANTQKYTAYTDR